MILLYMVAVFSNFDLVYGSRSEEENQRGEILDERQMLKPIVKPVLVKRDKGYSATNSKGNQNLKYVRVPIEEASRPEYLRKAQYLKTRGGLVPVYQVRTLSKTLPRPAHPKVVYVVQHKSNEQPHQVVYHENVPYSEFPSNYLSELSPNRIPIGYKHLQVPSGHEEFVGSYSHYGGVDNIPHQEIISPYVYREQTGKENVIIYSDGPISSVRTLPELTGNELYTYPKYEYKTVVT